MRNPKPAAAVFQWSILVGMPKRCQSDVSTCQAMCPHPSVRSTSPPAYASHSFQQWLIGCNFKRAGMLIPPQMAGGDLTHSPGQIERYDRWKNLHASSSSPFSAAHLQACNISAPKRPEQAPVTPCCMHAFTLRAEGSPKELVVAGVAVAGLVSRGEAGVVRRCLHLRTHRLRCSAAWPARPKPALLLEITQQFS